MNLVITTKMIWTSETKKSLEQEEGEKSTETENEYMIHRIMN